MKIRLTILSFVIFILAGCSNNESNSPSTTMPSERENPTESEEAYVPKEIISNLGIYNIDASTENKYTAVVSEFDLGYKEYLSNAGRIMPYNIKGIIGVPEGDGPFPLILITHGSHSNDDESKRFDTGYDYLVSYMAENGYIAVSMDMSKPYIWKYGDNDDNEKSIPVANDHMESLIKANEGNNPGYLVDLKEKIDFDKIGLIGHSRGGETIFDIATDQANKEVDIKALLCIAPTMFFEKDWPDTDVAILVPEYDGDVIQLDGFNMYRILNAEGQESRDHYVTLLKAANHNYFNRNIERNDALMRSTEDISDQLTREQQESFLMEYAVGFFNSVFQKNVESFINANNPQPNKMYGFDVKTMFRTNQAAELVDVTTTGDFIAEGVVIEATIDSWFFRNDQILIDTITYGAEPYNLRNLINIKWEKSGGRVIVSPNVQDFSNFTSLTLDMVIDSADELNEPNVSQRFTIGLKDVDGNFSKLILPEGLNALDYTAGEVDFTPVFEENIYFWSVASPLSSINLPLSEFKDVDLKHIESIEIIFDQTDSGSVYIDSILLQ